MNPAAVQLYHITSKVHVHCSVNVTDVCYGLGLGHQGQDKELDDGSVCGWPADLGIVVGLDLQ